MFSHRLTSLKAQGLSVKFEEWQTGPEDKGENYKMPSSGHDGFVTCIELKKLQLFV